jgi:tellurite resistance protein
MTSRLDLHPLFDPDLAMSADEARAIAGALQSVAESDGVHEEEQAMILDLLGEFAFDLGEDAPPVPAPVTPEELGRIVVDPKLRLVAVQAAVLLAMADGVITDLERERILTYAAALGVDAARYQELEETIVGWVKSGDVTPILA